MKAKKLSVWDLMQAFERAGFRYYAFGTLKDGRKTVAEYYKGDKLTDTAKAILKEFCPQITFGCARPEYAPEMSAQVVIIPKGILTA